MSRSRIAVVGGAGAMGRITVRDLAETARDVVKAGLNSSSRDGEQHCIVNVQLS